MHEVSVDITFRIKTQVIWEGSTEEATFGLRSEGSKKLGEAEARWRYYEGKGPEPGKSEGLKVAYCGLREMGSGQRGHIQGPWQVVEGVGAVFF